VTEDLLLGESLELLVDNRGKNPPFSGTGIPVISGMSVAPGRLDMQRVRYVSEDTWRRWMPVPTRTGDVILTSEAPLGRVARVGNDDPLTVGQRVFALRGRDGVLDSGFLYYALQSDRVQAELDSHATGTTVLGIGQPALRRVRIPAPSFPVQRAIAEVLGALDDKIAANATLIQTSEDLMVAFGARASADVQLDEISVHHTSQMKPDAFGECVAHYSLPAFDAGALPERATGSTIKSSKFLLRNPCVLVSKLNPRIPRLWNVPRLPALTPLASTEFVVLEPNGLDVSELWAALAQPGVWTALAGKVAGTSGSHQRVKPAEITRLIVKDPRCLPADLRDALRSLGLRCQSARVESERLAEMRDGLLPGLMSGKIRVRDAESVVEGVV